MLDPHTRFQKTLPLAGETHRGTRNLTISPDLGNKTVNLFMARIYWLVTKLLKFLDGKKNHRTYVDLFKLAERSSNQSIQNNNSKYKIRNNGGVYVYNAIITAKWIRMWSKIAWALNLEDLAEDFLNLVAEYLDEYLELEN